MSLQSELDAFKASWVTRVGSDVAALVDADNAALLPLAARALKAGDRFPALVLPDQLARPVDLIGLAARSPLVVTFYRGGWCPYCSLELRAYQAALGDISALGGQLVAVSPEAPDHTLSTAEKNGLAFPVLSDVQGQLADALGIRFELTPGIRALYEKFGHDLPVHNGDGRWSLPMPATYVVGKGGVIVSTFVDPDYRKRVDPREVIAMLERLSATAAH